MCFNQFIFIDIIVNQMGFNFVFQCLLLVYKTTVVFTFGCGVSCLKISIEEFLASYFSVILECSREQTTACTDKVNFISSLTLTVFWLPGTMCA